MNDIDTTDPLGTDVSEVNTEYPVLPAKLYDFRISKVEKTTTKETQEKNLSPGDEGYSEMLVFNLETTHETKDEKGNAVPPGHTLKHRVSLTVKAARNENGREIRAYTVEDIKKNIAQVAKSAGLSGTVRSFIENPAAFVGQAVRANVKISKETEQYGRSNNIGSFEVVS